ncbi:MAG: UDP-N-acetylmuramoyl-L-alanyl-D-glutamate--2,6-diaminopimelate ligase [Acidimicrobiia bacterium]
MADRPSPTLEDVIQRLNTPGRARVEVTGVHGDVLTRVCAVTHDSRAVTPGSLLCCIRGSSADGHGFAAEAAERGAAALLVDHVLDIGLAQIVVDDTRVAAGPVASAVLGDPSEQLTVVGVTGTNGKTTTTHLLAAIFEAAGWPTGIIGTLSGSKTTPEAPELQTLLATFRDDGRRAVVMEVSSHALALHRVDGTRFAAAVFTNLGRDHLDLHGSEERYFAAKARLFEPQFTALGIVNLDDVRGQLLADVATIALVGYGLADAVDLVVQADRHSFRWRGRDVVVPLGGRFNVSNSLAAATAAEALGIDVDVIVAGLATVTPVPGRFEAVAAGQPFHVVVDYAHTPDGLQVALESARETVAGGRVIVVFGCGGDRDAEKRPLMGRVAAELADVVIVTSDNPRSEEPLDIIAAVLRGVPDEYLRSVTSEPDRRVAIEEALGAARPGDMVVIAGKGHEATQTIGAAVLPFDDRAVARELLEQLT